MRRLLVLGLIFLAGCQTAEKNGGASAVTATIREVTGTPEVRSANAEWETARIGQNLKEGDETRTSSDGEIAVQLSPHGGVFTVKPDSTLLIERLGPRPDDPNVVAVLQLARGRVVGDTIKLPKGSKVVVKTSGGTFQIP